MFNVNFEENGYSNYNVSSSDPSYIYVTVGVDNSGNPGNAAYMEVGPGLLFFPPPLDLRIQIDLGAEYTINDISFDRKYIWNEPLVGDVQWNVFMYDTSMQNRFSQGTGEESTANNGQWVGQDLTFQSPVENVRFIQVTIALNPNPDWEFYLNSTNYGYIDNISINDAGLTGLPAPNHGGAGECPFCHIGNDPRIPNSNPISMRLGEKREETTDISLNTPAGTLAFTRSYRQSKQEDAAYQFMGRGWIHNHQITLAIGVGEITLHTPNGGTVYFEETTTGHYEAAPGSVSIIDWDSGSSQYTLTAADQTTYVFDSDGKLLSRAWPNGESWSYSYYDSGYAIDLLESVSDGYENGRKLLFSYIDNPGEVDHLRLWRVGDQDATDLAGSNPTGRYVEFSYTASKVVDGQGAIQDGSSPGECLLTGVRDVRGQGWGYTYYDGSEQPADVRQLNYLLTHTSPTVDTDGDAVADSAIILEQNSYTMQGAMTELAVNGSMEDDSDWTNVGTPTTNERSTTQVDTGIYSRHVVTNAADEGIEGTSWDLVAGKDYIITARLYPVTGTVRMEIAGEADSICHSNGSAAWETIYVKYTPDTGATGKTLRFLVDGNPAEFYVDSVSIIETDVRVETIHQERGDAHLVTDYAFQPNGENITTETTAGITLTHRFLNGVYLGPEDAIGNQNDQYLTDDYRPFLQQDANGNQTELVWSAGGKHLDSVMDALGHETSFVYNPDDTLQYSLDAEGRKTAYTYGEVPRQPTLIEVFDTDGTTKLRHQLFTYDSQGRTLSEKMLDPLNPDEENPLQETTRSYYTSGNGAGLLQTLTQKDIGGSNDVTTTYTYDSAGRVVKTQQSSNFGSCQISYTVYDEAGNVVASICNYDPGANPDPTSAAAAVALYDPDFPDQNRVTTHVYDEIGRRVKTTTNAGAAHEQTTVTLYDALNRVRRTISNYQVQGTSAPGDWVWRAVAGVWDWRLSDTDDTPVDYGTENNQNSISDTDYNQRGLLRLQRDVLGNVTLYGYNDAGRLVKTVRNASQAGYDNDYTVNGDPALASYVASADPDQDMVAEQVYDPNGNLVKSVDTLGNASFTAYDALNRPVKVIRNAGDPDYDVLADPALSGYVISTDPDQDMVEETEYDAMGRVKLTRRLLDNSVSEVWDVTLFGYDSLGRQVKVIRGVSDPDYDSAADPDLSEYVASSAADQDVITLTSYDTQGRAQLTTDALGNQTRFVYDGLGRQIRTVANFEPQATEPEEWVWRDVTGIWAWRISLTNDTLVAHGTDNDQNIVSETTYDADGRVQQTRDNLGRVARLVYDDQGRQIRSIANYIVQGTSDPAGWVWDAVDGRWEQDDGTPINHGTDNDQNILSETEYDAQGRVAQTFDQRHQGNRPVYDSLGRRMKTIANYVVQGSSDPQDWDWDAENGYWHDGSGQPINHGTAFDQNLISATTYNVAGQVVASRDVRGTETQFTYDAAGRRLTVTQAAGTPLETTSYTCYDKAGRVLRTIQNWTADPEAPSPDERDGNGDWMWTPAHNGSHNDRDLITAYAYDQAGRRVSVTDPVGNNSQTAYFKDGQVQALTDPKGTVTAYGYDALRRRIRVVQSFVPQATELEEWIWREVDDTWAWYLSESNDNPVVHGAANDQNIIVALTYDKGGRILSQRDPRGNATSYEYDQLNRRLKLTNPLSIEWQTAYSNDSQGDGTTRTTLTYPGVGTSGTPYAVQRDFDRLGRLIAIGYADPSATPDVLFDYDAAGNRVAMTENDGTENIRITNYSYDAARRLTAVGFDTDGDDTVDEIVSYEYNVGGGRTKLTLPDDLSVVYTYDSRGRLIGLTDWDDQETTFAYDLAGRHVATQRPNGLRSRYSYDPAGRLTLLRHASPERTLGHFAYQVNELGNRELALEILPHAGSTGDTVIAYDDPDLLLKANWSDEAGFKKSEQFSARLTLTFFGDQAVLTMGTGPDHSRYDIYIGRTLWQSFDGYAATPGQRDIPIELTGEGPHQLEIRNRAERSRAASGTGYVVRFKQLLVPGVTYDYRAIQYRYDALSRLIEARYNPGSLVDVADGDLLRRYQYTYDLAGNRKSQSEALNGGAPVVTNYTYNAANQIMSDGTHTLTYDPNGNLTGDGVNSYAWDQANRLLSTGGIAYQYDGLGNRIQQTVDTTVTRYLLDLQPGLAVALRAHEWNETDPQNPVLEKTTHYIHSLRGIHAQQDNAGNWNWMVPDGLGSVRGVANDAVTTLESRSYAPYGEPFGVTMVEDYESPVYGFTGEPLDENGLLYLRARYYAPELGVFTALDPFEGMAGRPMSLNGYLYVYGNPVNLTDGSGLFPCAGVENDADCEYLRRAIENATIDSAVLAVREAAFGKPEDINDPCPVVDETSLDCLVTALTTHYPIVSIVRNLSGDALIPTRQRSVVLRLAEALIIMNRKLSSIGLSLSTKLSNPLNISFEYVVGADDEQGYVNMDNRSTFPMQLGNNIITDAIVHEWGHAFDREANTAHSSYLNTLSTNGTFHAVHSSFKPALDTNAGCDQLKLYTVFRDDGYGDEPFSHYVLSGLSPESREDYQRCHVGYGYEANPRAEWREDWADMFMNWVYDGYPHARRNAGFDKSAVDWAGIIRRGWMERYVRNNL